MVVSWIGGRLRAYSSGFARASKAKLSLAHLTLIVEIKRKLVAGALLWRGSLRGSLLVRLEVLAALLWTVGLVRGHSVRPLEEFFVLVELLQLGQDVHQSIHVSNFVLGHNLIQIVVLAQQFDFLRV